MLIMLILGSVEDDEWSEVEGEVDATRTAITIRHRNYIRQHTHTRARASVPELG